MEFVTHQPPPALRGLVEAAHGYRVPANPTGLHRGLPSRHLTLVVELHAPLRVTGPLGTVTAHGVVGGLHSRPALIDASSPQDGVHYALIPSSAQALLGVPAAALGGRSVDLADLLGPDARRLVETVAATPRWRERFAALDAALLGRLRRVPAWQPEVTEAWWLTFAHRGRLRVGDVAAHVGWSRRHLSQQFRQATGLTPKEAARVARFEAARELLTAAGRLPLARIAALAGYSDQAHLTREWRSLAGCTPGTWLREELPFVQDNGAGRPQDHTHG